MGQEERIHGDEDYVAEQERAAAEEAIEVGGGTPGEEADESERALSEAGQGEAEGFELAEEELIDNATHEELGAPDPIDLAGEAEEWDPEAEFGEADSEQIEDA
jgi:hypothetical protein